MDVTGGCLCGHTRYVYGGAVGPANYCHCSDCRKVTGGPFNISVRLNAQDFRIVSGPVKGFTKRGDSGNELTRWFCADCGSPIYTSSPSRPEFIYVKAGSLDDPLLVKPSGQDWAGSMVPWARLPDTLQP